VWGRGVFDVYWKKAKKEILADHELSFSSLSRLF